MDFRPSINRVNKRYRTVLLVKISLFKIGFNRQIGVS